MTMTLTRARSVLSVLLAVVGIAPIAAGTSSAPRVRILSPVEGAFIIGPTVLRAEVEPPGLASSVVFFVDGRQVCTSTNPPFECGWDAGPAIAPHQVRLVVNLVAGERVVRTARTAGIEFAE